MLASMRPSRSLFFSSIFLLAASSATQETHSALKAARRLRDALTHAWSISLSWVSAHRPATALILLLLAALLVLSARKRLSFDGK